MKSFSILIIAVIFRSSFNPKKDIPSSNPQLILSDSCRLSKIYLDEKVNEVYHYDSKKNLIQIDYHSTYKEEIIKSYYKFKYDDLNRLIEKSDFHFNQEVQDLALFQKKHFIYSGNSNLISEIEYYSPNLKDRTKQIILIGIEECTYDSKGLLVKSQIIRIKKKRKKTIRILSPNWSEYKYDDRNNPIIMELYSIINDQRILTQKIEMEFDVYPYIRPKFDIPMFTNNLIKRKTTSFNRVTNEEKVSEIEFDYQYTDEGLISNRLKESYGKTSFYEYEYICD